MTYQNFILYNYITTNYKFNLYNNSSYNNKSILKIIKIKNKKNIFVFYKNPLNIYLLMSDLYINLRNINKTQIPISSYKTSLENNSGSIKENLTIKKNISLPLSRYIKDFVESFNYPKLTKFWLLGRFFRIKKSRKKPKVLRCALNYSHKLFYINPFKLSFTKKKRRIVMMTHRILFVNLIPFNDFNIFDYNFYKLRKVNQYSALRNRGKGLKCMNLKRFKRIGKSESY